MWMDLHTPLATARLDHILHEVTQVADERYPALEYIQRVAWAAGVELQILRTDRHIDVVAGWAAARRHVGDAHCAAAGHYRHRSGICFSSRRAAGYRAGVQFERDR